GTWLGRFFRVGGHVVVDERVDRHHAARGHQEGIAVGSCLGGCVAADVAAGARLVFDYERLSQRFAERLGDGACDLVGRAARREVDDDGDRFAGPLLGRRRGGGQRQRGRGQGGQRQA